MRTVLVLALLMVGVPAAGAPKQSRPTVSLDGRYTVRFEQDGRKCRLSVTDDEGAGWSLRKCVGTADDLYFVSGDGQRVWVIYPLPAKPKRRGQKALRSVVVARLYGRDGRVRKTRRLGDFWGKRKRVEVRELARYFKWAEGTVGVPGKPPRLTTTNRVELETLEPKTVSLKF